MKYWTSELMWRSLLQKYRSTTHHNRIIWSLTKKKDEIASSSSTNNGCMLKLLDFQLTRYQTITLYQRSCICIQARHRSACILGPDCRFSLISFTALQVSSTHCRLISKQPLGSVTRLRTRYGSLQFPLEKLPTFVENCPFHPKLRKLVNSSPWSR